MYYNLSTGKKRIKLICLILFFVYLTFVAWSNKTWTLLGSSANTQQVSDVTQHQAQFVLKWPPENPMDIQDFQTGSYNITLPVRVDPIKPTDKDRIQAYVDYLYEIDQTGTSDTEPNRGPMSLERLMELDQQVRIHPKRPNYMLYPQALDLHVVIDAIRRGDTVRQAPINNPELKLTVIPRDVCNPNNQPDKSYDLVVMVKSCALCFDQREHARQTFMNPSLWTQMSIGFVFVIGQPVFDQTVRRTFYGHTVEVRNHLPTMSSTDALSLLKQESARHGDLLVGSFEDTYFNLTLKQITMYRWATIFCRDRVKLFLLMDHDRSLVPQNVQAFVKKLPMDLHAHLVLGIRVIDADIVNRPPKHGQADAWTQDSTKWMVSRKEIPWDLFPPFVTGPSYLIGSDVVHDVTIAHAFTREFRLEDVYLGIILYKLNRIPVSHPGFAQHDVQLTVLSDVISGPVTEIDRLYDWTKGRPKSTFS